MKKQKESLEEYFERTNREHLDYTEKELKEVFRQTFDFNEPLFNLVLEKVNQMKKDGQQFHIYLDIPWKFDVEIEDDFCEMAIKDEDEAEMYLELEEDPNSWEATGWERMSLDKDFANLLGNWNWDNLALEDGRILLFSPDGFMDEPVFYALDLNNLVDDIIVMWGDKKFSDMIIKLKDEQKSM